MKLFNKAAPATICKSHEDVEQDEVELQEVNALAIIFKPTEDADQEE